MDDDLLVFADEDPHEKQQVLEGWKVLVADDEKAVHLVTKLALGDFRYDGRPLELLSAYGEEDVKRIMVEEDDIALVLLDVVMDSVESGFNLIRFIRDEIRNKDVRIILRTGQSGTAPEDEVIINYDINDFKDKTELTISKLRTTIISALKAYRHLKIIAEEQSKLEESRLYLDQIIEGLEAAVITVDPSLKIVHWNSKAKKLLGIEEPKLEGLVIDNLSEKLNPLIPLIKETMESQEVRSKTRIPFGDHQVINLNLRPLVLGEKTHLVIRLEDVSTQIRNEALVQRRQRMDALSTLIGGGAQRLEALYDRIGALIGPESEGGDKSAVRAEIQELLGSVRQFLSIPHGSEDERTIVNLGKVFQNILDTQSKEKIKVDWQDPPQEVLVFGNESGLRFVFEQMVDNAAKAVGSQGQLRVRMEVAGDQESKSLSSLGGAHRNYWKIWFSDDGPGIPKEVRDKMFDPYFTTWKEGAGLGLTLAGSILENHHGFMDVESQVGQGTSFILYLPMDEPGVVASVQKQLETTKNKGKILVCDDEAIMRQVVASILGRLGFEVVFTTDGYSAIEEFQQKRDEIQLVLLDMLMPGMDGVELFHNLKEIDPNVKVIITSGFGRFGKIDDALSMGVVGYVPKPFGMETLAKAISDALKN